MQLETINSVPINETRPHLRVATITNKNTECFFYIGSDHKSFNFLSSTFISGFAAENFENAKTIMNSKEFSNQSIDVFIIDIPYRAKELRNFCNFLKYSEIHHLSPVLYHNHYLRNQDLRSDLEIIDDVIDLHNWQFDFSSKISFLRNAKKYDYTLSKKEELKPSSSIYKRGFDIFVSLLLLIIAVPVFLLIALAIKLESKGPIFYNAKRAGRGFKIFKFYKFRTMIVNADKKIEGLSHLNQYSHSSNGAKFFKIANDPRITKVGKFLRNTSLDELPQLFNVLKGDMSLVGNRPLPLYEAATLTTNDFVERFMAPAGITGLWQIKKRGKAEMSIDERIGLDISYARRASFLYDFWIMAKTPAALLQKSNV